MWPNDASNVPQAYYFLLLLRCAYVAQLFNELTNDEVNGGKM